MKVLGVTGGVGSGKSEVLRFLEDEYGAEICQLDEVAKDLQKKGGVCYAQIKEAFGSQVVGADGELDRQALAAIIFQDDEKRKVMNAIVHPEVKRWVEQDISSKRKKRAPLYVIEAALLPEAGYEDVCGEQWYIYAKEDVRRKRLRESRGYTDEKISRMIRAQSPEPVFRQACNVVIDNSGAFEDTKKAIKEVLACSPDLINKEEIGDRI